LDAKLSATITLIFNALIFVKNPDKRLTF
jgi:hypothetical protein